jgi:selenide,water dikinase
VKTGGASIKILPGGGFEPNFRPMIKLTQTVQKGGCAAKVAATELRKILSAVRFPTPHPDLLVDGGLFDDAAIYKVTNEIAMVQTLDFFTPIVDTPSIFGKIAAANSLSDVYAMGGVPKTAMGILAFPLATMDSQVIVEVMQGACDVMSEAHVNLVGGHSIDDDTLKFGLSVTGYVHPEKVWSNAKAQAGDLLILTKPLGTGTLTAALKRQALSEEEISDAILSMTTINSVLDLFSEDQKSAIHSATDITGFGFLGHAMQMAKASQKTFQVELAQVPVFERAWKSLSDGFLTKAHRTNAEYVKNDCEFTSEAESKKLILMDPQTSGGLLLSVSQNKAESVVASLRQRFLSANIIGQVSDFKNKFVCVN